VEILPRFGDKRRAVEISQKIESDISVYLITITIMNAVIGVATAIVMWSTGLGDPILWGHGRLLAELRADPRSDCRRNTLPARRLVDQGQTLAGVSAGSAISGHSFGR
jgi:hypothetical protein